MRKLSILVVAGAFSVALASLWIFGSIPVGLTHAPAHSPARSVQSYDVSRERKSAISVAAPASVQRAASDFDGDGRSDLLLRHAANAWLAYWTMDGPRPAGYSRLFELSAAQSRYDLTATADFSGDGRADLLLTDSTCCGSSEPLMRIADGSGGFTETRLERMTSFLGTGDVDGDGKADILLLTGSNLKLGYWIMDGAVPVRKAANLPMPLGYLLVATGDFNGDGRVDLLWKATNNRKMVMSIGDGQTFATVAVRDHAAGWEPWGAGDVDGDGRSDVLMVHPASRWFAYWTMDGATPVRYSPVFPLPGGESLPSRFGPVTAGDYNGDGKIDLVHSRQRDRSLVMWLGDGSGFTEYAMQRHAAGWRVTRAFTTPGAPVQPYVEHDINGDGRSDLLVDLIDAYGTPVSWLGYPEYFISNWRTATYPAFGGDRQGFRVAGTQPLATGDFDGDGRLDMVAGRQDAGSGARETFVALSSREVVLSLQSPLGPWQFVGSGDVDADGRSDLLLGQNMPVVAAGSPEWRNPVMDGFAYWVMQGTDVRRYSLGFRTDPDAPRLAAKGDFNGDGKLDLVWSSLPGAQVAKLRMWLGDGDGFTVSDMQAPAYGWNVFAGADVDGDGRSDLMLRNGEGTAYWRMESAQVLEYSPGFLLPTEHVDDFNGDGLADLIYLQVSIPDNYNQADVAIYDGDGRGFRANGRYGIVGGTPYDALRSTPPRIFSR